MPRRDVDKSLFVRFERIAKLNKARSYGEKILNDENQVVHEIVGSGKPEFDNVDYILIQIPGDKDCINHRPATFCLGVAKLSDPKVLKAPCRAPRLEECDVHRFVDEFERYKAGQEDQTEGTSLRSWPGIDPASVEELAFYKVFTVESLSELNDSNAAKFFALRQRARDFLEAAEKTKRSINVRGELDAKDAQIKALQDQVNQILAAQGGKVATAPAKEKR